MSANMLFVSVGITERQAQRILAKLKAEGEIIRHGANKNGYWEIIGIKIPNSVSEIQKVNQRLAFDEGIANMFTGYLMLP